MIKRRHPPLGILPVVVAFIQIFGTSVAARRFDQELTWSAVLLLLAGPALLLLRRKAPGPMVAGIGAVSAGYLVLGYPWGPFPLAFAVGLIFAVLASARWWAWGSAVSVGLIFLRQSMEHGQSSRSFFVLVWLIIVLLIGELARSAKARRDDYRKASNERAKHQRDEERLVVARDIHDVVAHSLSMINVQASVALHLAKKDSDPTQMYEALENIKASSKEALIEVREVLAVLRQDAPRVPSLRLEQLDELVSRVRSAGLSIDFAGPAFPVPGWITERIENILYRVVQESLTNVIRHAQAHSVLVSVKLDEQQALVNIADDGIGIGTNPEGNGLSGMRERLNTMGGTLEISRLQESGLSAPGTTLKAWIPAPGSEHKKQ